MSVEHSLLGKDTQYPTQYQPEVLFPISALSLVNNMHMLKALVKGKDWWHVFEISWLIISVYHRWRLVAFNLPASSPT